MAWVLADRSFERVDLPAASELGARLARLRRAAAAERLGAWNEEAAALWREWLSPVLVRLPPGADRLLIVPDSELFDLPFRALLNPATGRFLDQDFVVALAPSLGMLAGSSPVGERLFQRNVLSLGFGTFAGRGHRALPSAATEARSVEEVYGRGSEVSCAGADWASLRTCLPRARVIHLVTHAAASAGRGGRSWLALPEEDLDLKRLWKELPELPATELVVLAACESVAAAGGEGLGGLARPFLARGARAVVGTLQPIEDEAARTFFLTFHRAFAATGDAAEALQKAREEFPRWQEQPWEWGGSK